MSADSITVVVTIRRNANVFVEAPHSATVMVMARQTLTKIVAIIKSITVKLEA